MELAVQRGAGDIATGSAGLKLPESAPVKTALHPSERMPAAAGRVRCSAGTISANDLLVLTFCCPGSIIARPPSVFLR